MQTQLPDGLRALMQASQILQQASSPIVQTPVGPRPTVAGAVSQGLQQVAQEKAMPDIRQQAGIAGQIQAQRMAQQQQMAQDPQAIAQMAAQMMQRPEDSGVAALPVNMQFKDGGIVGYNGEDESLVEPGISPEFGGTPSMGAESFEEASPQEIKEMSVPELQRYYRKDSSVLPEVRARMASGIAAVLPTEFQRGQEAGIRPRTPPQVTDQIKTEAARFGTPTPVAAATVTRPAKQEAPIVADTSGIAVPSAKSVLGTAQGLLPDITQSDFFKQIQKNAEEREKWLSQQSNLEQEGIKLIQQSAKEREALLQSSKQNDNFRRFMAAMNTVRYGNNDYVNLMDRFEQRDENARKASLAEQDAIQKFKQAEQARLAGKFDRADALAKTGLELFKDAQKNQVSLFGSLANMEGQIYSSQMTAATAKATEASRAADRAESRKLRESTEKEAGLNRLRTLIKGIDEDIVTEERKFSERPEIRMAKINMEALQKNPAQYKAYLDSMQEFQDRLKPLKEQRKAYLDQLKGTGWGELSISEK